MRPLSALGAEEARHLRGLLFDLDDTVLSHGLLTRGSFDALWQLREAGLKLVAVTGRPSGWGAVLARQWPMEGCVAENGAVFVVREGAGVSVIEAGGSPERARRGAALEDLVEQARVHVPDARLTDDVAARRSDVTWDIGERERLAEASIAALVALAEGAGARTLRSSVHLHATFDGDDKASGAVRFCSEHLGEDPGGARSRFAFVGDSGNDASCFAAFRTTFGVANVVSSLPRLTIAPRYVASLAMGDGFAEVVREVLRKR